MTRAERRARLWRLTYSIRAYLGSTRRSPREAAQMAWDSWRLHDAAVQDNPGWGMPSPLVAYRFDRELDEQHERLGR